jgi:hypothetical protein
MTNAFQLTGCLHHARSHRPLTLSCARLTLKPRLLATAPDQRMPMVEKMLFPNEWLDSLAENDPEGRTNREVQREVRILVPLM